MYMDKGGMNRGLHKIEKCLASWYIMDMDKRGTNIGLQKIEKCQASWYTIYIWTGGE
jgi:hypothetical protein